MIKWMLLLVSLIAPFSHANLLDSLSDEPKFLPVDEAFPLTTRFEGQQLIADWDSSDGYYLYKSRIYLSQQGQEITPVSFSQAGKEKDDPAFGIVTAFYGPLSATFDLNQLSEGEFTLHHQGCADAGLCYPPQKLKLSWDGSSAANTSPAASLATTTAKPASAAATSTNEPADDNWFTGRSWAAVVGLFFLLGIGLTFTPCVLPMVPILTSVVLGQNNTSPARGFALSSIYVLGMALTYAAAGLTVGLLGAGANVQAWMQTPWVLAVFAALFVALALAMFGLYELQLPSGIRNRLNEMNQKQQGGHWLSVFIMGVLSALVVSPCVSAPLAGALVYLSTTGDAWLGGSALLALGLGMGAPLIVLGTTGASILPKAGGWMDQIKVFFGVLLLGVAIWLLSRVIPGEAALLLWALLALVYGVVLGAFEPANSGKQRLVKGIAWVFFLYGAMALVGVLQGQSNPLQPLATATTVVSQESSKASSPFRKTDSISELEQIIANSPRPVMVDFYADWCISCKVMEAEIFSHADVQRQFSHLTWVKLDVTANSAEQVQFMQKHGVFGPPTILFFDQSQEVTPARIVGEVSKPQFVEHVSDHFPSR
ncbi:thiol:disulfide interchange protein DsbD [Bacterioplanes sanyensis]|uniref:protein-disulfide reductase DsbD n=1 Tax=Bacterioplanes sanyensis TaxID=1249553 RepID=UPI001673036D|nr:protein-disulfide reductase DsbD [Bacterioplanes sanyensis]GGY46327.1 thiol:disulfide interchange protein DsbD [Bacterioplanes sanyensis]